MKTYMKPELKELVLAPQESISLDFGDSDQFNPGSEIIVPDDFWGN